MWRFNKLFINLYGLHLKYVNLFLYFFISVVLTAFAQKRKNTHQIEFCHNKNNLLTYTAYIMPV